MIDILIIVLRGCTDRVMKMLEIESQLSLNERPNMSNGNVNDENN